jgi:hypothetical protein
VKGSLQAQTVQERIAREAEEQAMEDAFDSRPYYYDDHDYYPWHEENSETIFNQLILAHFEDTGEILDG